MPPARKKWKSATPAAGKVYTAKAKNCDPGLLARRDSVYLRRTARQQKEALASAQKVPLLYTNVACATGRRSRKLARVPSTLQACITWREPRFTCEHGRLRMRAKAGGAYRGTHDEGGLPSGTARTRNSTAWAAWNSTPLTSKPWSARFAISWPARLGPGGFDPARDIAAITVNRWPHGYAYEYNSLFDAFWLEGGETPCEIARKTSRPHCHRQRRRRRLCLHG